MIAIIVIICFLAIAIPVAHFLAFYLTHLEMVKEENPEWINFKDFIAIINLDDFYVIKEFPNSLFSKRNKEDHIHADIITINGQTYKFHPWGYIKYRIWKKNIVKNIISMSHSESWWKYHLDEESKKLFTKEEWMKI